ncbi:hypothetical protein J6590_086504 [Homalodisca vitripennis]|nr:hypothetical protein J6590_086504 [Homalodisca vitripennis]
MAKHLESDAVTDLTPGRWSHVRLKRYKIVGHKEALNEDEEYEVSIEEEEEKMVRLRQGARISGVVTVYTFIHDSSAGSSVCNSRYRKLWQREEEE